MSCWLAKTFYVKIRPLLRCYFIVGHDPTKRCRGVLVLEYPVTPFWCCCWKRRHLWGYFCVSLCGFILVLVFLVVCCGFFWLIGLGFCFGLNNLSHLNWKFFYICCLAANWLPFLLVQEYLTCTVWKQHSSGNQKSMMVFLRCYIFKEKNEITSGVSMHM